MNKKIITDKNYASWLKQLKERVRVLQLKAAVKVNTELLTFYWELGADIVERQKETRWGDGFLSQLSKDLMAEFPDMKGFSFSNLKYVRRWYLFYNQHDIFGQQAVDQLDNSKGQQLVAEITQIPWGHNLVIISKFQRVDEALFYVRKTIENSWSRSVLTHQIESGLINRSGKAITNFDATLPSVQSDLAKETIKDPYCFDFLTITEHFQERELEQELTNHITKFLLELGKGFSFVGKQYKIEVNKDEFFIDLLFYHTHLHCYVVIELKTVKFKPDFAGQLNFYISAVDDILKTGQDNSSIGILICKEKNKTVVEYALKDIRKPIGVSEYAITKHLPKHFKSALPAIEEIEAELTQNGGGDE